MSGSTNEVALAERLARVEAQLAYLVDRQKKTEELFSEMTPILKEVMSVATGKLAELEGSGYFAFGKELLAVGDRIATGFSPDDVRQLGDAIVGILQTVRALTQPKVLEIAGDASRALENADQAEPLGLLGVVRATRDDDVQKGMAVMMEVMRHVGRAAAVVRAEREADPRAVQRQKLAATLGPRRKKALGIEREPARPAAAARASSSGGAAPRGGTSATPATRGATIDGVAFGADGHLADPAAWTAELAAKIAAVQGVELDAGRWAVIRFAREDFEKTGAAPNIRRITQGTELATKDLYTLFPKAPARTIAKIAGIPKPAGCI